MEPTYNKHVILICAKKHSTRLPRKHVILYDGKLLYEHTFDMIDNMGIPVYLYTDDDILFLEGHERGYNIIPRPYGQHYKEPSMDMMKFLHDTIKADTYLMLPLTSPNRDKPYLKDCIADFLKGGFSSATSLKKMDRKNYCLSGAFWFFDKGQVLKDDLIDDKTKYYIMDTIDIDTVEDVKCQGGVCKVDLAK